MKSLQRGYTIIEIVIAISLIAIFIALPVFAYSNFMQKSRDGQRKADISRLQSALESYKTDNGVYPAALAELVDEGYIAELPVDPLDGQAVPDVGNSTFGYEYYASTDGNTYNLLAPLEEGGATGGAGSSNKRYIVANPAGQKVDPIPTSGLVSPTSALQPTATLLPTRFRSPTNIPSGAPSNTPINTPTNTPTPIPAVPSCNSGISCTGSCQAISGRCGSYTSSRSGCTYTTLSGGGTCNPVAAPDQSCTVSGGTCSGGLVCSNTYCVTPSATPFPACHEQGCATGRGGSCCSATYVCGDNPYDMNDPYSYCYPRILDDGRNNCANCGYYANPWLADQDAYSACFGDGGAGGVTCSTGGGTPNTSCYQVVCYN